MFLFLQEGMPDCFKYSMLRRSVDVTAVSILRAQMNSLKIFSEVMDFC